MSEAAGARARNKLRIENLSDLVFGLALSIGSITLISNIPKTPGDLLSDVVLFGFSFAIVIWIWSGYTRTMAVLPFEIAGTFALNVALLFCVAIEPYLFYVLQLQTPDSSSLLPYSSSAYGLDTGAMMFILAGLVYLALREGKSGTRQEMPESQVRGLRSVMLAELLSGILFVASVLPVFWVADPFGSFLRFDLWYASFAMFFVLLRTRGRPRQPGSARTEARASVAQVHGRKVAGNSIVRPFQRISGADL